MCKKTISVFMTALILHLMITAPPLYGQPQLDKKAQRAAAIKAKAEGLGIGADIKGFQTNERQFRGRIEELMNDSFILALKNGTTSKVSYNQVTYLEGVSSKYKTKDHVDPVKVRQVAWTLGPGKKVKVKLASEKKLTGRILSIESGGLTIQDSRTDSPASVQFKEVTEISRAHIPTWARVAIIGGGTSISVWSVWRLLGYLFGGH